jgi:hypothetical protein
VNISALDYDVAGQPAEAEPAEPRPQQPDDNEHEANCDKPPARRLALSGRAGVSLGSRVIILKWPWRPGAFNLLSQAYPS